MCSCPVGCLAWGIPMLEPTGYWVGQVLVLITQARCLSPARIHTPWYFCHQFLWFQREPQPPPASPGGPPRPAGRSCPGSYEVTTFALGPGAHETLCVPSKSGVSLSPCPVELLQSSPAGLQSQMLWGLLCPLAEPPAEEPVAGLRTLTPVGETSVIYSLICGSPTWGV